MKSKLNFERDNTNNPPKPNALVVHLERNLKDANQLKKKLSSYHCEPQTYSLFERIESLRSGLESFSATNEDIINAIRAHKKSAKEYVENVKQQYSEFNRLQEAVEEYMGLTRSMYIHG